jgi:hypothetical protein
LKNHTVDAGRTAEDFTATLGEDKVRGEMGRRRRRRDDVANQTDEERGRAVVIILLFINGSGRVE